MIPDRSPGRSRRGTVFALFAVVAIVAVLAVLGHLRAVKPPRRPGLSPCTEQGMPAGALCGTHEVFENRTARAGRKIPLQIVVLPAAGPGRLPDPFVYFAGGPGEDSIS